MRKQVVTPLTVRETSQRYSSPLQTSKVL